MNTVENGARLLVVMYEEVAPALRAALAACKQIEIRNVVPVTTGGQPYDVECVGALELMQAKVRRDKCLLVSDDFSTSSVYGPDGNSWFRYVHDMGHMLYDLGFDAESENTLHQMLWDALRRTQAFQVAPQAHKGAAWLVYQADTKGQTDFHEKFGEFPEDQTAFVGLWVQHWEKNFGATMTDKFFSSNSCVQVFNDVGAQ